MQKSKIAREVIQKVAVLADTARKKGITNQKKEDGTDVTIADIAGQILANSIINESFPEDMIIGEESDDNHQEDYILQALDLINEGEKKVGASSLSQKVKQGVDQWVIDPIDGTKGYVNGEAFGTTLCILSPDNQAKLSYIAVSYPNSEFLLGLGDLVVLSAQLNEGITLGEESVSPNTQSTGKYIINKKYFDTDFEKQLQQRAGVNERVIVKRSVERVILSCIGEVDVYINSYLNKKLWDIAPSILLAKEAGMYITDLQGKELDCSTGAIMKNNTGGFVIAKTKEQLHEVIALIQDNWNLFTE